MSGVEDDYLDVLQNIEFIIVQSAHDETSLIDMDVLDAMEALVRHYVAEENGRRTPDHRLAEKPARLFTAVKGMCEWRLGRQPLQEPDDEPRIPITLSALIQCLRRIVKSIRRWNQYGRKGYLEFVSQYIV